MVRVDLYNFSGEVKTLISRLYDNNYQLQFFFVNSFVSLDKYFVTVSELIAIFVNVLFWFAPFLSSENDQEMWVMPLAPELHHFCLQNLVVVANLHLIHERDIPFLSTKPGCSFQLTPDPWARYTISVYKTWLQFPTYTWSMSEIYHFCLQNLVAVSNLHLIHERDIPFLSTKPGCSCQLTPDL